MRDAGFPRSSFDNVTAPRRAFMNGRQAGEDISEKRKEHAIWEIVDREFVGKEFAA
jgi:hypothetical protein